MVGVAQLVRVPDCDSGCCRFKSGHPPEKSLAEMRGFFVFKSAIPLLPSLAFALVAFDAFGVEVVGLLGNRLPAEHVHGALAGDDAHVLR